MQIARWWFVGLAVGLGCGGRDTRAVATAPPPPPPAAAPAPPVPPEPPEQTAMLSPDVPLPAPVVVELATLAWGPGPDALPPGVQLAVIEGAPPFPADKSFTMIAKMPPDYTIPPHTHLVTERVTVLDGEFAIGHGPLLDRAAAKPLARGGIAMMPADHVHFAFTGDQGAVIALQGVGPWGIYYVDPADDPRDNPPPKPPRVASRYDAPLAAPVTLRADEVAFAPAPAGMLPPGAEIAILEGDPAKDKTFTLRVRVPHGYRFPVHRLGATDRAFVLEGALLWGYGERWDDSALRLIPAGGVALTPKGMPLFVQAKGTATFQLMGTGPLDVQWAEPLPSAPRVSGR